MNITEIKDEPRWVPQVITGGKFPPGPEPYLLYFKKRGLFFAKDNTSKDQVDLILFEVVYIYKKARLIMEKDLQSGNTLLHAVDPISFCRRFELYEVLFEGKEDDEPVNRADTSAGNANDEPAERVNLVDEGSERR